MTGGCWFPGRRAGRAARRLVLPSMFAVAIGSFPLGLLAVAGRVVAITAGGVVLALTVLDLLAARRTRRPVSEGHPR